MMAGLKHGIAVTWVFAAVASVAWGQTPPAPAGGAPAGKVVLSNDSPLRGFLVFRTPVLVTKEGEIKVPPEPEGKNPKSLPDYQSSPPPA